MEKITKYYIIRNLNIVMILDTFYLYVINYYYNFKEIRIRIKTSLTGPIIKEIWGVWNVSTS